MKTNSVSVPSFYDLKCKDAKNDFNNINQTFGLSIKKEIEKSSVQSGPPYYYNHPWCIDTWCEYKDKCERSLTNIIDTYPSLYQYKRYSDDYFSQLESNINKTNNIRSLKLIESEVEKCANLRNLHQEFCSSSDEFSYVPYIYTHTGPNNEIIYGDYKHGRIINKLKSLKKEIRNKINLEKVNQKIIISPKRKTPRNKTTRRKQNKNRKQASSFFKKVSKKVSKKEIERKNYK